MRCIGANWKIYMYCQSAGKSNTAPNANPSVYSPIQPAHLCIDDFKHVLLRNGAPPPLRPEFPLVLDILIVTAVVAAMLTFAALSFRKKE